MKEKKTVATGDFVAMDNTAKATENKKSNDKAKKKNKKPNIFKRFSTKCKDVISELKKVSWPTFGKVVKQTGVVLAVVIVFLVVITAFDTGLAELLGLLNKAK